MSIINRLPIGGEASSGAINVFTQIDEPDKKDGIWIQTNKNYNNIVFDTSTTTDDGSWTDIGGTPLFSKHNTAVCQYDGFRNY